MLFELGLAMLFTFIAFFFQIEKITSGINFPSFVRNKHGRWCQEEKALSLEYSQYQPSAGSLYPHRVIRRVDDKVELVRITSDLSANAKIKDSEFDRPGGTFSLESHNHCTLRLWSA